jgi:hypothetical protein
MVLDRQGAGVLRRHELGRVSSSSRHVRDGEGNVTPIAVDTAPAHNYILGVDFQGADIWVATAKGLSHGIRQK